MKQNNAGCFTAAVVGYVPLHRAFCVDRPPDRL